MNVLFCVRVNLLQNPAGDSVQILETAEYLRAKGLQITIDSMPKEGGNYDIIHLFNLTPIEQTYACFRWAKNKNMKVVISPIYWNLEQYYKAHNSNERLLLWKRHALFRKEILEGCAMIYPSGRLEMENLTKEIGIELPYTIVRNGVHAEEKKNETEEQVRFENKSNYILCAARICPRKNQLALAQACHFLGQRLILAGDINNQNYLEQCLQYNNVSYAGFLGKKELSGLYKNASLHVLPSFAETPGLASMEAAICGCNLVSTTEGDATEYFEDMATYCDPYDKKDILRALEKGLVENKQPCLKEHLLHHFTWEKCLESLYQSYITLCS